MSFVTIMAEMGRPVIGIVHQWFVGMDASIRTVAHRRMYSEKNAKASIVHQNRMTILRVIALTNGTMILSKTKVHHLRMAIFTGWKVTMINGKMITFIEKFLRFLRLTPGVLFTLLTVVWVLVVTSR